MMRPFMLSRMAGTRMVAAPRAAMFPLVRAFHSAMPLFNQTAAAAAAAAAAAVPLTAAPLAAAPTALPDLTPLKLSPPDSLYALLRVHTRPFLVTKGDLVALPYNVKQASVGDKLTFDDVTTIGNSQFTYHQAGGIDPQLYEITGVVVDKTKKQLTQRIVKQKRQRGYRRAINKSPYTVVRISELRLL